MCCRSMNPIHRLLAMWGGDARAAIAAAVCPPVQVLLDVLGSEEAFVGGRGPIMNRFCNNFFLGVSDADDAYLRMYMRMHTCG